MTEDRCHWNGERRVLPTHLRDCQTAGCEGCEPCRRDHCAMPRCSRHLRDHEPLTCPRCVGETREKLTRIGDLCRLVLTAATEARIDSPLIDLAGPVAERSTWRARWVWAYHNRGLCRCLACPDLEPVPDGPACEKCAHQTCRRIRYEATCPALVEWLDNADDERHPLWVLGTWDMLVAEHLDHTRRNRVTVPSAVNYLNSNLTYLAQDQDFAFDELAREVADCLTHVEQVLLVAEYVQRGAPCQKCRGEGRKGKPMERRFDPHAADDSRDEWVCPTCGHTMTLDDYAKTVYVEYLSNADRLTAAQIQAQYRVPESTVRRWASGWTDTRGRVHEPTVRRRGKDQGGRMLYDVSDVVSQRDTDSGIGEVV